MSFSDFMLFDAWLGGLRSHQILLFLEPFRSPAQNDPRQLPPDRPGTSPSGAAVPTLITVVWTLHASLHILAQLWQRWRRSEVFWHDETPWEISIKTSHCSLSRSEEVRNTKTIRSFTTNTFASRQTPLPTNAFFHGLFLVGYGYKTRTTREKEKQKVYLHPRIPRILKFVNTLNS